MKVSSENSKLIPGAGFINNTLAFVFVLGWQGGTVNQVAAVLGVPSSEILSATEESMGFLLRLAEKKRAQSVIELTEALEKLIKDGGFIYEIPADVLITLRKNKGEK